MVNRRTLKGVSLSSFAQPKAPRKKLAQGAGAVEVSQKARAAEDNAEALGSKLRQVTVNVKILKQQQDWLRDTAQGIRDNNDEAVPACDRVYPQHLIQVAIDMLKAADVNWAEVHNAEELRQRLDL